MRFKRLDFDDVEAQIRAALPDGWAVGPTGNLAPLGKRGWHIYGPFRSAPVGSIWQYRLGRSRANFEAMVLTQWGPVRSLHREPSVAAVWVVSLGVTAYCMGVALNAIDSGGVAAIVAAVMAALAAAHSFIAVSGIMFDRHTTGGVPLSNVLAGCPDSAGEARESILAGITYAEAVNESTLCMLETLRGVAVKWMFRALMVATIARLLM